MKLKKSQKGGFYILRTRVEQEPQHSLCEFMMFYRINRRWFEVKPPLRRIHINSTECPELLINIKTHIHPVLMLFFWQVNGH